jgi:hypothetical protein
MNSNDEFLPKKPQLTILPCEKSFKFFIEQDYLSDELKEQLHTANVLIIPDEGYGELTDQRHFSAGTIDLFQYILEKNDERVSIGVCLDENDYKELSLHADWVYLAEFVVKDFIAPLIVALLADYIIRLRGKRIQTSNVKSKLIVVDTKDEHRVEYIYDGPATEYKEVMLNAISKFGKEKQSNKRHKPKRKKLHGD